MSDVLPFSQGRAEQRALADTPLPARVRHSLQRMLRITMDELDQGHGLLLEGLNLDGGSVALRPVQEHWSKIREVYEKRLGQELAGLRSPSKAQPGKSAGPKSGPALTLMDENRFDAELNTQSLARRAEARARLPLHLLGQRFGVLAGQPALEAPQLPLGPVVLSRALIAGAVSVGISRDGQEELLRAWEQVLLRSYAGHVDALNAALVDDGVLPSLTYVPIRLNRPASGPRTPPHEAEAARPPGEPGHEEPAAATPAATPHGSASAPTHHVLPPSASNAMAASFESLQALLELRRAKHNVAHPMPPAPHASGAAAAAQGSSQGGTQAMPMPAAAPGGHAPDPHGTPRPTRAAEHARQDARALPTETLLDTLTSIQQAFAQKSGVPESLAEIKQRVLASNNDGDGQPSTLSRKDEDTFELLEMLYAQVERDIHANTAVALMIKRLQLPLLQTALSSKEFFQQPSHPARELFGAVAEAGARWHEADDIDKASQVALEKAVDHVVANAHQDPNAFATGHKTLQQALNKQAQRAEVAERRNIEAARGRERLELAKLTVASTLTILLEQEQPPKFVRMLLEKAWSDAMTLPLLRHGEMSSDWTRMVEITREIASAHRQPELAKREELAGKVESLLAKVGFHANQAPVLSRKLVSAEALDEDISQTELLARIKTRSGFGEDEAPAEEAPATSPRDAKEQAQYQRLSRLSFGTWIEFDGSEPGQSQRQRLSWYSPMTGRALFVNKRGQKAQETTLDVVARRLAAGTARVVDPSMQQGVVERAWQATINTLRNLTGQQAGGRGERS